MVSLKSKERNRRKWLIKGLRWIIGIIVLYCVIHYIDFTKLKQSILSSDPWLIMFGLVHSPLLVVIAALRWRFLLNQYHKLNLKIRFAISQYWIGVALGLFTPSSIGLDAYRIIASGRRFGEYTINIAIILVEKLIAMITCMSIIVVLYPVVPITLTPQIENVFYLSYFLLFVSALLIIGILLALRNKILSVFLGKIEQYIARTQKKIAESLGLENKIQSTTMSLRTIIEPLLNPKIIIVILLSFSIQIVSSVKSQIFFCALGYNLPFIVNLFVAPTLYFIFMLPVSFGSIGIREGVYVFLYGLFGVPIEIALLVSFLNFFGMMINNLIGGIIMIAVKPNSRIKKAVN